MPSLFDGRIVGVPNKDFTPDIAARLGEQFGSYLGKKSVVVSGRDYNPSSRMLKRAFTSGLMSVGVEVLDFHESLNGEISFSIKRFGAKGGFLFTTSHSVKDSVLLRLFKSPGFELTGSKLGFENIEVGRVGLGDIGWVMYSEYIHKLYVSAVLSFVKVDEIIPRGFKLVVHTAYSPADMLVPDILKALEADYVLLQNVKAKAYESTYPFTRELERVCRIIKATDAELGVVVNNDASSMVVIDGEGRVLLPEEVMFLIALNAPRGSLILADSRVPGVFKKSLAERDIKVVELESEEELIEMSYKMRPYLVYRFNGSFEVPLFSLGYDAVITLVKLLESIAMAKVNVSEVVGKYREKAYEEVKRVSPEKVSSETNLAFPTLFGYYKRAPEGSTYIVYKPEAGEFSLLSPRF
jgi:phosphomannomutase